MNRISQTQRPHRRDRCARRGAAVIEFAICLPMLTLLVFGTIESASRIFLKQTLSVAAYESAREAIRNSGSSASATERANTILASRKVKDATITFSPTNVASATRGQAITVRVSAPTQSNSPVGGQFIPNKTITAEVVMVKE